MFRVVLFSFFLIFASVPGAFAQDTVRLRAGEHDGYARLVFDMGKSPVYSASDNTPGQLVISFSSPATLDDSAYKADPPKNVRRESNFDVAVAGDNLAGARIDDAEFFRRQPRGRGYIRSARHAEAGKTG
jgi:hypothetical protein